MYYLKDAWGYSSRSLDLENEIRREQPWSVERKKESRAHKMHGLPMYRKIMLWNAWQGGDRGV